MWFCCTGKNQTQTKHLMDSYSAIQENHSIKTKCQLYAILRIPSVENAKDSHAIDLKQDDDSDRRRRQNLLRTSRKYSNR